jgi:gliding motility-associated-like protein
LQTSPIFENVSAGIHQITVSDPNGCSTAITETDILVIKHPKFFTPNADGINDSWKIDGLTNSLITKIYIFDRYGKLLKEIAANGNGWDGTYLGVPVPADDYWFTVDYVENLSLKKFKSHFSLKR